MTYLEMVNEVLVRMREVEIDPEYYGVASKQLDPQQKMICKLVNDARNFVIRAHTWNAFRTVWILDLAHGVSRYNLRGGTEQSTVSFIRYDDGPVLKEVNQHEISSRPYHQAKPLWFAPSHVNLGNESPVVINPSEYNVNEYGAWFSRYGQEDEVIRPTDEKCVQVHVWPIPDNSYGGTGDVYRYTEAQWGLGQWGSKGSQLFAYGYAQPQLLYNDDDLMIVPDDPVMHFALAYAISERGEAGGVTAQQTFALAKQYLSDAISWDVNNSRGEYIWEAV
jgi:hypothetical protein